MNGTSRTLAGALIGLLVAGACDAGSVRLTARDLPGPTPSGARLPQLYLLPDGRPLISWLEARPDSGFTFRLSQWDGSRWSAPRVVADDPGLIMFDADLHGVTPLPGGALVANWEIHTSGSKNPWATVMQLAVSRDSGRTWSAPVVPHGAAEGEHGFVATFPLGDTLGLVWLDEREPNTIGLRAAALHPDGRVGPATWVDSVTCECCANSAAVTRQGPVVVFRNRFASTATGTDGKPLAERDIYITRLTNGQWTEPRLVHADHFLFNGCPDNGPAVDARGDTVVVAWWTAPNQKPAVRVAFSTDAGTTFGAPLTVDEGNPEGQVTVAFAPEGAVVGWLEDGTARARWVSRDGAVGRSIALGPSAHHARLPHWLPFQDGYLATWTTEQDSTRAIRMAVLEPVR